MQSVMWFMATGLVTRRRQWSAYVATGVLNGEASKLRVEVEAQTDSGDPEKQCERFAQKPSHLKRNCSVEHGYVAVPSRLSRTYDGVRQTWRRH